MEEKGVAVGRMVQTEVKEGEREVVQGRMQEKEVREVLLGRMVRTVQVKGVVWERMERMVAREEEAKHPEETRMVARSQALHLVLHSS